MLIAADKPRLPTVEEGLYNAVCTGIIDLGIQTNEKFKKSAAQIRLIFELLGETYEVNDEEHVRQVGRDFTLSLSEKSNLRKLLEGWRGKSFTAEELNGYDLKRILGKAGQLQIIHKEGENGTYAIVNAMMPLPKGMAAPKPENPLVYFDMSEPDTYGEYELFPDFLKEKISAAENFDATGLGDSLLDEEEEQPANTVAKPVKQAASQTAKVSKPAVKAQPAEPVEEISPDDDLSFEINGAAA